MQHWIYHPVEEAKIVDSLEIEELLTSGWYDNPSKFPVKEVKEVKVRVSPVRCVYPDEEDQEESEEDKKINKEMVKETLAYAANLTKK